MKEQVLNALEAVAVWSVDYPEGPYVDRGELLEHGMARMFPFVAIMAATNHLEGTAVMPTLVILLGFAIIPATTGFTSFMFGVMVGGRDTDQQTLTDFAGGCER